MTARRFPPPWSVEELNNACFVVRDCQRPGARFCLFRGRAGAEIGGEITIGRLRIGSLVSVCVVWRAAPVVGSGVCRAARKLPPTKKPITPANNIQIQNIPDRATNQMRMPPALS